MFLSAGYAMSDDQADTNIIEPLRRLSALDPGECIQMPPRRMPLNDGSECLVEWRGSPNANQWQLRLSKRPGDVDNLSDNIQQFIATLRLDGREPAVKWSNHDIAFSDWAKGALPGIVEDLLASQQCELDRTVARAAVTNPKTSLRDFIPHIVILIALAAFAYMFAIVHIKI